MIINITNSKYTEYIGNYIYVTNIKVIYNFTIKTYIFTISEDTFLDFSGEQYDNDTLIEKYTNLNYINYLKFTRKTTNLLRIYDKLVWNFGNNKLSTYELFHSKLPERIIKIYKLKKLSDGGHNLK